MDVSIRAVDFVLTNTLRSAIEERLACALAWAGRQTARLGVLLCHRAGPDGQRLECCKINVQFRDGRQFVIEDSKPHFHLAAERAANRVDRLLRQVGRLRRPRSGQPAAAHGQQTRHGKSP